jgi:hypothetical protein
VADQSRRPAPASMRSNGVIRSRCWLSVGFVAVIALGLASRTFPALVPAFFAKHPGDSLWALMVFLGWGFIKPRASTGTLTSLAFATSCSIEFSQLYQAPWLDEIRRTTTGHLVLGSSFSWLDIAAYAVGASVGALVDALLVCAPGFAAGQRLRP